MKKIVFTLKDGSKVDFDKLTGMSHDKTAPEAVMKTMATTAMHVDPQIVSYEIVDL